MLKPPVQGEKIDVGGNALWMAGGGPPLLLVHSVNAAASAAEVRPVFEGMKGHRTVYALDLPGFGSSRRAPLNYTPRLMTDAVIAALAEVRRRHGGQALPVLGLSLGCEFVARAAVEQPAWVSRLALVSPTGFRGRLRSGPAGSTNEVPGLHAAVNVPLWSQALFGALTRPGVVRFFLRKTWGSEHIDESMAAYAIETARQPGARHAPLAFLSGKLFSADIGDIYQRLQQPVWMSHGTRGDFVDYRGKVQIQSRAHWQFTIYEGGALPFFEWPQEFLGDLEAFLGEQPPPVVRSR